VSSRKHHFAAFATAVSGLAGALLLSIPADSFASRVSIQNNTPRSIQRAQDLGAESTVRRIEVTVWLRPATREAAADRMVAALYDRNSPVFHRWMSNDEAAAALSPSAANVATIREFLAGHNLAVSAVGAGNHYVKATGSVADIQRAFNVQLHRFQSGNRTFRANTSDPAVDDPAGSLIASVDGLSEHHAVPHSKRAVNPETGQAFAARPLAQSPTGVFFSGQCLRGAEVHTFTTGGGLPKATYTGNRYGQDIANTALGTLAPCGYQPSELQAAYGLNDVYSAGLTGSGQTIVIVDAYGSPTIAEDAELFSQVYGLPDLTPANFTVYFPGGQPAAPDPGWAGETTLDVEWAHAMAPNANIALVVAPTSNDSDLQAAVLFAIQNHLGNVISNSYGEAEGDAPPALLDAWNRLARLGAAVGISVNFSSGDDGDSNPSGNTGVLVPGVSTPADSPWATAVGGTSVALDASNNVRLQTGWGTNLTEIADTVANGSPPVVPPFVEGFIFGAGGGTSGYFAKPAFQSRLNGRFRMVPDIAFTADPYTGVEIICNDISCGAGTDNQPVVDVIGGTSLACPMFSGVWAIANQSTRHGRLGQAARMLYDLPHGAITDVVPVGSINNVRGILTAATGSSFVSASQLIQPETTAPFYSAFYNSPFSTRWFAISFGTDTSLSTRIGWDNVTGLGTPNGLRFINAVRNAAD